MRQVGAGSEGIHVVLGVGATERVGEPDHGEGGGEGVGGGDGRHGRVDVGR